MAGKMEKRRPKADKTLVRAMPKLAGFHAPQRIHLKQPMRCPGCGVSGREYIPAQADGLCADCSWEEHHEPR